MVNETRLKLESQGWVWYENTNRLDSGNCDFYRKGNFSMGFYPKSREFLIIIMDLAAVVPGKLQHLYFNLSGVLPENLIMKPIEDVLSLVPHEYRIQEDGKWIYVNGNGFDRYFIK